MMSFTTQAHHRPIIVMAGGTGGHVFPALAVANELRDQGENIVWIGTRSGIESRLVPAASFPIEWLTVQGLRGKGVLVKALAPFKLLKACWQAWQILRRHKPRAVLGMGGFAAGPGGLLAWIMRIPLIIHEQNAVIGLTNKILSHFARINFFAFPQAAQDVRNARVVGNPVRKDILGIESPDVRLAQRENEKLRVLVLGGSLGARTLNHRVPSAIAGLPVEQRPLIRHQCGALHLEDCSSQYQQHEVEAEISDFIEDMKSAYEWADLVICRAGALTVSEICAAGVASILVPYPYAVDDHQFVNSQYLAEADAAIVVREQDFDDKFLCQVLTNLNKRRELINSMAHQARSIAFIDATQQVAAGVLQEALT